jgi:hypothetical protein
MFGGQAGRKNKRLYRGGEGSRSLRADLSGQHSDPGVLT